LRAGYFKGWSAVFIGFIWSITFFGLALLAFIPKIAP
jgi:hypothetical protein